MNYKDKYLKYKSKYSYLREQLGGVKLIKEYNIDEKTVEFTLDDDEELLHLNQLNIKNYKLMNNDNVFTYNTSDAAENDHSNIKKNFTDPEKDCILKDNTITINGKYIILYNYTNEKDNKYNFDEKENAKVSFESIIVGTYMRLQPIIELMYLIILEKKSNSIINPILGYLIEHNYSNLIPIKRKLEICRNHIQLHSDDEQVWLYTEIDKLEILKLTKSLEYPILSQKNISINYIQNMIFTLFVYSFFINDDDKIKIHNLLKKYLTNSEKKILLENLILYNKIVNPTIINIKLPTTGIFRPDDSEFKKKIATYIQELDPKDDSSVFFIKQIKL
jgi:hypothetical protein